MVETPASLAETLYQLRTRARLSQEKLAELAGISKGQVGNLERGVDPRSGKSPRPQVETLRKLADALATDLHTGEVSQERADQFYLEMATAAGYFDNRTIPPRERAHALLLRDPRIMTAFEAFPDNLDDDDVDALRRHLDVFADMVRRRQR